MKNVFNILKAFIILLLCFTLIFVSYNEIYHLIHINDLPVLGYHNVVSDQDKETKYKDNIYVHSVSEFKEQLDYLKEHQYKTYTMEQVYDYYNGKFDIDSNSVVLTFDDGYESFHSIVEPILKEYGFVATCFVIGSRVGRSNRLTSEELVNDDTVEYYSHSYDMHRSSLHGNGRYIELATEQELNDDFDQQDKVVSSEYFAYPYGLDSKRIHKVLKERNCKLAFTYNDNRNMTRNSNQYALPRYLVVSGMPMIYFKWMVE